MSDLHCAATVLLVAVTDPDPQSARELAQSLMSRRVARVFASSGGLAQACGAMVAAALGVDAVTLEGVEGDPALSWVPTVADQHRGETVLVLTDGASAWHRPGTTFAELSVDADGVARTGDARSCRCP